METLSIIVLLHSNMQMICQLDKFFNGYLA